MDIPLKMNRDFEKELNKVVAEYGEDFEYLNGFHESQMNFSDFIEGFIDKNVADTTIDSNANASNKDIRSLMSEKGKSIDKIIAFNKIFYEHKKKYGLKTAREWLNAEYNGEFYMHDAPSSTYMPYCIMPQECCVFIYEGKRIHASMEDIYNTIKEIENYDSVNKVYYKRPNNLMVLDINKKTQEKRYTKVNLVSKKDTDEDFFFVKAYNGANLITTESHKYITTKEDTPASYLLVHKNILYSDFDDLLFTNSIYEYAGLHLTSELGWLIGMYLAEGYEQKGQLSICQNSQKSKEEYNKLINTLTNLNIPYNEYRIHGDAADVIRLKNGNFKWEKRIKKLFNGRYCNEKRLCLDYVHFNNDFLKGLLAGIIDGDGTIASNKNLMIRMTSRTLINQIREIGLHFGVFFGSRLPYIQSQEAKIRQTKPMYSANINMNRDRDFFLSLPSIKIRNSYTNFNYDEKYANKNYICEFGQTKCRDMSHTYKPTKTVYDLSTETHTFLCNNILIHNCYAYDLSKLATEGLFFLNNYNSKAPKHLTTFIDDVVEYISFMSNRSSGAVGIPNILVWTYYFWKKDCDTGYYIKDPKYYLKQCFQKIIYRLNQPFMRIDQTAFVNVSIFDRNYVSSLFGGVEYPDGSYLIDDIEEFIEHQKIFMRVVSDIRKENMFTFPVLTYSLLYQNEKFVDEDFARWCSDHNTLWNDSNFFESDNVSTLSNCCRLLSDTSKLNAFINSIGGTALSIGSIKVNTINLMRIAYETNYDEKKYLSMLKKRTILCCKTLDVIRHIIQRNVEKGLLPNYQDGAMEMSKQYCTVGILGLYEVIEAFGYINVDEFGCKSYTEKGIEFASKILNSITEIKDNFTDNYSFNIESVPAERAAIILCQKDNLMFDKKDKFIYSNQWIPLSEKCSIQEKIRLSSILDKKCSGGAIAHINIENNFPTKDSAWDMLNYIAKNGVMYFAFNSKINECENHHGFVGTNNCPECGEPVQDTYQRIVGYLVPTRAYSKDRFNEFTTRKWYEYSEMSRDL